MTEIELVCLCFGLVCVTTVVTSGVILHRAVGAVTRMTGASFRATDHERRAQSEMTAQLIEKATANPERIATLHAQERVRRMNAEAATERAAIQPGFAPSPATPETVAENPEDAAYE